MQEFSWEKRHDYELFTFKRKDAVKFFKTRTFQVKKIFRGENHETKGLNNWEWHAQFSFARTDLKG